VRTLIVAAACLLLGATPAAAATYTVNTTDDTNDVGGCTALTTCSLREALTAAGASSEDDVVDVPAGHFVLSLGELSVGSNVEIAGAATRSTIIDANGASRVLGIDSGAVSLRDLTITGGSAVFSPVNIGPFGFSGDGGGILTTGATLDLTRVAVVGNRADLNGGGIAAPPENATPAVVTVTDSTIANNAVSGGATEGQGGGIYIAGGATLTNTTVAGNSVSNPGANVGGGIAAIKGAASAGPSTITLLNTTVAGNSVTTGSGGGYAGGNPAGTFLSTFSATNSIVAGNTADGAAQDCDMTGLNMSTASDHDLSGDASCGFTDAGSLQNTDPKLGVLADNGGPTDTRAPAGDSPAVNAGTNSGCPAADQRGISRPQAGTCDIGAFELVFAADLSIAKVASPDPVTAGGDVTYTITVNNRGPQPAAGINVTDALPPGVTLVSFSGSGACAGTPLVCTLPDLGAGAGETLTLVARTSSPGQITNTATVAGAYADPDLSNNTASVTTTVQAAPSPPAPPLADLRLTAHASRSTMRVNDRVVILLSVRNMGPTTATGVTLSNRVPRGLRIVSVRGARRCSGSASMRCSLAAIAAGKTRVVKIVAIAHSRGRLRDSASVAASQHDPRTSNNRAAVTVRALPRPAPRPRFTG
jgi:uncharacterized repeat protein (TIGR01451 family)/CSLREA domain-containing protein